MVISKQLPGRRARRLVRDLTLLLLVLFTSLPAANAQQGDIILPTREASIRTALDEIDHQTAYSVSADLGRFDADRKVMFSSNRLSIRDVLAQALGGTGFTWRMEDRRIVLVHRSRR